MKKKPDLAISPLTKLQSGMQSALSGIDMKELQRVFSPSMVGTPELINVHKPYYYESDTEKTPREQWADALDDLEYSNPEQYRCLKVYFLRKIRLKDWSDILSNFNNVTPKQGQRWCKDGERIALSLELPMPRKNE